MSLSAFIARRIAFNKERTFSRFIIRIAVAATALSVAIMLLATALVNGFQQVVSQKVFSFWGHIHVVVYQPNASPLAEELPFKENDTLLRELRSLPQVQSVHAYATKSVILKTENEIEGVIFKGITRNYNWSNLQPYIISGRKISFPDSTYSDQIIISSYLANELKLKLHDKLIVYFIQQGGQMPRPRVLHITAIYKTSIEEYDKTYIIGDLRLIAQMNNWPSGDIGGYEIFLKDYHQMDTVSNLIYQRYLPDQLVTETIRDIYPNIFDWLHLQNMNEVIIIIIMVIVATINMITAILILILERTNMIGVLKALGMPDISIQEIFIYQSGYIIMAGLLIGNIIGLSLGWLEKTFGFFKLREDVYYMPVAPISFNWWDVAAIDAGTLLICILILIVPSMIIKKIYPVKAIGFR